MKRIISVLAVAVILAVAPSAMAQSVKVKVPKLLCIDMDIYPDKHQLALKSTGSIYDPSGNVKTYAITGRDYYGPISGSGYVAPNTTTLYATYSGSHRAGGPAQFTTYDLVIDLTDIIGAGTITTISEIAGGDSCSTSSVVDIIQCATLDASFSPVSGLTAAGCDE